MRAVRSEERLNDRQVLQDQFPLLDRLAEIRLSGVPTNPPVSASA
jgi:hypothetical protein